MFLNFFTAASLFDTFSYWEKLKNPSVLFPDLAHDFLSRSYLANQDNMDPLEAIPFTEVVNGFISKHPEERHAWMRPHSEVTDKNAIFSVQDVIPKFPDRQSLLGFIDRACRSTNSHTGSAKSLDTHFMNRKEIFEAQGKFSDLYS